MMNFAMGRFGIIDSAASYGGGALGAHSTVNRYK